MKKQDDILKINAYEMHVITKKHRNEIDAKDRLELFELILNDIKEKAEKGDDEIDLLPVLNNFLKTKNKVYNDFFLSDDDFNHIFKELKARNFLVKMSLKMSQFEINNINIFISW